MPQVPHVGGGGGDGGRPAGGVSDAVGLPADRRPDYTPYLRELVRAWRWAEAERDAAAGRMAEATGRAAGESGAWRGYLWGLAARERDRAAWLDGLARWLADAAGRRVSEETRARVEREALDYLGGET